MPRPPKPTGERALIAALARQAQGTYPQLRLGIGDDCALLRVPRGHELAVTTDLFLERTHFRRDWHSPEEAGHRCLARGLSDLAAMGARPLAAFLSWALPPELVEQWSARFLDGFLALARRWRVPVAGGDTAQAPGNPALFSADITLLGSVPAGQALLRSGSHAGDLLYVTGALGGAAAELASLPDRHAPLHQAAPGHPHLFPEPRVTQGQRLRPLATAAIDLSDGISTDLAHLCDSSGLYAEINEAALPIHPLARSLPDALAAALHGGEDYELLFAAAPATRIPRSVAGIPITLIGRMLPKRPNRPQITLLQTTGKKLPIRNRGWQHLSLEAKSGL